MQREWAGRDSCNRLPAQLERRGTTEWNGWEWGRPGRASSYMEAWNNGRCSLWLNIVRQDFQWIFRKVLERVQWWQWNQLFPAWMAWLLAASVTGLECVIFIHDFYMRSSWPGRMSHCRRNVNPLLRQTRQYWSHPLWRQTRQYCWNACTWLNVLKPDSRKSGSFLVEGMWFFDPSIKDLNDLRNLGITRFLWCKKSSTQYFPHVLPIFSTWTSDGLFLLVGNPKFSPKFVKPLLLTNYVEIGCKSFLSTKIRCGQKLPILQGWQKHAQQKNHTCELVSDRLSMRHPDEIFSFGVVTHSYM